MSKCVTLVETLVNYQVSWTEWEPSHNDKILKSSITLGTSLVLLKEVASVITIQYRGWKIINIK